MMKHVILTTFFVMGTLIVPVSGQGKLYPVPIDGGFGSMRIQAAPSTGAPARLIAQKAEYSLRLGFPTDVEAGSLPETDAKILMLWLKIQNLTDYPMNFDPSKFTASGEGGKTYPMLSSDQALDRMIEAGGGITRSVLSRATQGISLGRLGKSDEAQLRDEAKRFSLQPGSIQPQGVREGLLFFEAPSEKRFTVNIGLVDLWSKPFIFTNVKPRN